MLGGCAWLWPRRVEQTLSDEDFLDQGAEERELFVNNVLSEVEGNELRVASDLVCSRVLEKLVRFCSSEDVHRLFRGFVPILDRMLLHRNASHVLQAVIPRVVTFLDPDDEAGAVIEDPTVVPGEDVELVTLFSHFCTTLQKDLADYVHDQYASHVVRATIAVLAGMPVSSTTRSKRSKEYRTALAMPDADAGDQSGTARPAMFVSALNSITDAITSSPKFSQMVQHRTANPVVQTLLDALNLSDRDRCMQLCQTIAAPGASDGACAPGSSIDFQRLVTQQVGSHLAEKILQLASPQLFYDIYVAQFRGRVKELATHPVANYVVSKLFEFVAKPDDAAVFVDELVSETENLLAENRPAIVVQMVGACGRHAVKQAAMCKALFDAFHVVSTEQQKESFRCLMGMTVADQLGDLAAGREDAADKLVYNLHGARLLEKLAEFNPLTIKPLVLSLIALNGATLLHMSHDKDGSRVLEAFIKADIGDKRKKKLLRQLKGHYAAMAANKFGSHVVDRCWAVAPVPTKKWIADELLAEENTLKDNYFGKLVLRNCKIDYFKRQKDEW